MKKLFKKILTMPVVLALGAGAAVLTGGPDGPSQVQAQNNARISMNVSANPVRPGQVIYLSGQLLVNGRPAAHAPVVAFVRPFGGPDMVAGNTFTDHQGRYQVQVRIPQRPGQTVQVSVTSGGGLPFVARTGEVLQVR